MKICACRRRITGRHGNATLCAECAHGRYRHHLYLPPAQHRVCKSCGREFTPIDEGRKLCPLCYGYTNVQLRKD